jgi:peptidoglycan/LPS O-acetylase OafA/YrhL
MRYAGLEDPPGFAPVPRIVIAYVVPFTVGWLLYGHREHLNTIRRSAWPNIAIAAVATCFYLSVVRIPLPKGVSFYADRAVHSVALWFLIFGVTGLFLRYLDGHSFKMRYMSDASYFLYLAHMPVIIALQFAFEPLAWNPLVKIPIVLAIASFILIVLYHYCVRPTVIGAALNGRKYPIGRQLEVAAAAA